MEPETVLKFGKPIRKLNRHWWRFVHEVRSKRPSPDAVSSAYGIWITPNLGDFNFIAYRNGGYGYYLSGFLHSRKAEFVFLDIGSNQGLYAIIAAQNKNCRQVFAFEPVASTAGFLDANVQLNGCDNVTVIRKAVTENEGVQKIQTKEFHTGVATLRQDAAGFDDVVEIQTINKEGLDKLVTPNGPQIIVKIDVEGHELVVLEQVLQSGFRDRINTIFYECDEAWFDPKIAEAMLRDAGFQSFEMIGSPPHYDVLAQRSV